MRLMTTLAAPALLSAAAADAGAVLAPVPEAMPASLEAALEALTAARAERDDALTAGAEAIKSLGEALASAEARAVAAEKAAEKAEKALAKVRDKSPPAAEAAAAPALEDDRLFAVQVVKGSVRHGGGKTTAPDSFDAPESDRESLLDLRARGVIAFAD